MTIRRRTLLSAALCAGTALLISAGVRPAAAVPAGNPRRIAVVYVSRTGNMRSVAQAVHAFTGADLFAVEPVEPYPDSYRPATEVVKDEIERNYKRPIKPISIDLSQYDVVLLGTPTWWHRPAQLLKTWLETADLTGKTVATFQTHGGGGVMEVRSEFESILAQKKVGKLGTHFLSFGGVRAEDRSVRLWLGENGLV